MKIYLIGFMGCGKSTAGKHLATHCGFPFVDTDKLFEAKHDCSVETYFAIYGENAFRQKEALLLRETASMENAVIATGGGMPCFHDSMDWIRSHGISVYLEMPPAALCNRLKNSKIKRPILQADNLLQDIEKLLPQREKYYKKAHITISGLNVDIPKLYATIRLYAEASKTKAIHC